MQVDQPVPMPSAPLINTTGKIGKYQAGSTLSPSSSK